MEQSMKSPEPSKERIAELLANAEKALALKDTIFKEDLKRIVDQYKEKKADISQHYNKGLKDVSNKIKALRLVLKSFEKPKEDKKD